jgi:chaperone modulatory protein CbpM
MIINRLEFIQRAQIDQKTLEVWLQEEWLVPNEVVTDMEFSEVDLARAIFILDLRERLGINDEGVGVILHLVDQVHGLRRMLGALLPESEQTRDGREPSEDLSALTK